jgi:hypothetical protein
LKITEDHLNKVVSFDPFKKFPGVADRESFAAMVSNDPAFAPFGLTDDRYIVARLGGNLVTSLHRKIGDLYEALFQYLLRCRFKLGEDYLKFSVEVAIGDRTQTRSTDGMVPRSYLADIELPLLDSAWQDTDGLAFELRSCYQIGDSKRIQADWDMALALEQTNLTPVMLVFCNTSLQSPVSRLSASWRLFEGEETFGFIRDLTGFDLANFMKNNQPSLTKLVHDALAKL